MLTQNRSLHPSPHQSHILSSFRRHLRVPVVTLMMGCFSLWSTQVHGATLYWDSDGNAAGNAVDGTGLGGTGTWDTTTANWWNLTSLVPWPNTSADIAVFSGAFSPLPNLNTVTLASGGVTANQLSFVRSGYTVSADTLTLAGAGAGLRVNVGDSATINSLIAGSSGLTMSGGGSIRLGNNANTYTGTTSIENGAVVITGQGALGTDTSAVVVTRINASIGSASTRGFGGGALVLDGTGGNINFSRSLTLFSQGPWSDRGGALLSTGVNTLSGQVDMGGLTNGANLSTRIIAADGTLNLTGTVNVQGTAASTISNLGGVNQAGASFYNLTGVLAGTGTLESSGGGTLFLNPSDASGFSGTIRVSGSAASGQSVVRIDSPNVLGTRTSGTTGAVLDLNGGILAVLMDSPQVKVSNGSNANVYFRASSTIFADHTPGSSVKDQTVAFGNMSFEDNITLTFNSRNGYGMSFTTAPVNGGNADSTLTNNLQGGALLSFTGNFWSNADNTGNRTMTIGGNGNTAINGNIIASAAAFNHNLTKTGTGTLTLTGTASTLDGNVNVNGGTVAISDWRAITNNTSTINIGTTTTGATLSVVGNNVLQANLTTSKVINLAGTTGGATILANQTGTSPGLIFNANFTATGAGAKTLTLGGTNTATNTINGAIVDSSSATSLTKIDAGRWVLAGTNTYTGATTISNGTLQLNANAAGSTILADTSAITFNAVNNYAGGTLEFVGQASANNVENLGALTPTAGAGTIKVTPGSGGTASLVFSSLGAVNDTATINVMGANASNTVTITGATGLASPRLFFGGSDFAFAATGVLRAPVYGTDADFAASTSSALTSTQSNQIVGSFSNGAVTIDTLKINGSHTLTLTGALTVRTGAAGTDGAILQTGGSGTITGSSITTGGSGSLTFYVDGGANTLTIQSALSSGTTGGITKSGAGTLRLEGANAQTGTITINEGTIRLAGSGTLGGAAALTIRQDGILELNGINATINAFNNNGIVRNTSATTDVTYTVGGSNGTGTSNGIIEDGGAGKISVVKLGTGAQSWLGLSTYTGTTTIGSTGIVSINNLQNGGMPSGIGASSNVAANLIFNGASTTQAYGGLNFTGTTNDETDRLFTFDGGANGGVRIQSNGVNGSTSSWTNTGALAFGPNAAGNPQGLVLGGASTGDNRFFPVINDNGAAATSVYKADAGVWYLMAANGYTGATTLRSGTLYANDGTSLPTASNLVFEGGNFASTGSFSRTVGTGSGQLQWTANGAGGFSAGGSPLTVNFGSGNVWGSTPGFLGTGALLLNNSGVAKSDVDVVSGFEITQGVAAGFNATTTAGSATVNLTSGTTAGLAIGQEITGNPNIPAGRTIATIVSATQFTLNSGTGVTAATSAATNTNAGGYRQVNVGDFTSVGADYATISGVITGAGNLAKEGAGILNLRAANTYTGQTLVRQGTLVVETLGSSATPGATSVGDSTLGNTDGGAIALGNGGTTGGILEYVGVGETSDRKIRLNTTTGTNQIHADGVGSLILTNVANDMTAGAKTLSLRGVSAAANFITSQLSDNGGALAVTVDGSTAWVLTNPANNYTGTTTVGAGALGIGDNAALGSGNLDLSSGTIFAYGADRTVANVVRGVNNTGTGVIGDYSLTFTNPLAILVAANNYTLTNSIVSGKSLTFAGATANSLPNNANRVFTVDGSGDTNINGDFTTTQTAAGGLNLTKTGDGVLTLGGSGGGVNNFNRNNATIDLDRGTLRLGADEVIGHGVDTQTVPVAYGSLTMSPELANGDTAIFDLNGRTETINGLTATTDGTSIIDNTSASPASLIIGANNSAVNFGGGTGTYTITDSGAGALSLTKTGTAAAIIPTGVTLSYQGGTTVNGGSLTLASPVNGTNGLSVFNSGSVLALTGGITAPAAITSITAENGTTLSLLDGAGNKLSALTALTLGSSGGTFTDLNLNVGDASVAGDELNTDLLTLLTGGTLNLFAGNKIRLNLTDIGLNASQTYDLLSFVDGGFTSGPLSLADWVLGSTPGGFSSITLNVTNNLIQIQTGTLITGSLYWRGLTDTTWNANVNNWSTDKAGTIPAATIPGAGTDVIFAYDGASGALVTTLEQNFKVNSLTFEAGASTPTSVTINPGVVATNRIEVAPQVAADGIKITAGGPASVTISGPVKIGSNQTWTVADAGSVLSLGALQGEANVTKQGSGKVILSGAADPTFNGGATSVFTINAGTLELGNSAALGSTVNANLASVVVNSTGAFYLNNATAGTVANPINLAGGILSGGGNNHTYSGAVNVSADSFINLADSNGPGTNTARNITLSGVVSGSGNLTIDGNNTASGGNQLNGTLTLNNAGDNWTGDLFFNRGTVTFSSAASPSFTTNDVTFNSFGRVILQGVDGQTINRSGTLSYAAGAVGEFQVDNTTGTQTLGFVVNQNGGVTLGSGGTGATMRVALVDTLANLNITGGVTLGGSSSISVSNSAARLLTISGVISDGGSGYSLAINDDAGGWAQTNGIVRLTGLNTFSGNLTVDSGTLEFDTASTVAGSVPNSLGQGTTITMGVGAATLSFIGSTSQLTDRPITTVTSAQTLSANGTGGATITYAGAITVGPTADGSQLVLTGTAGSGGIISGGITQTGDTADMTVNGATWTHQTGTSRVADDMVVSGANTILNLNSGVFQVRDDFTVTTGATLNLNGGSALSFSTATLSADASLRATAGGTINLGANDAVLVTDFDGLRIGTDATGVGTLNMGTFNQTINEFILGNRNLDRTGIVDGTGTLTVTGNLDVYNGTINANLASTGANTLEKIGAGTVTLKGDNSGLAATGATIVYDGILNLDYTVSNTTKLRAASQLDLRGARVNVVGNNGAATTQSVGSLTLGSGGSSTIQVTGGTGQDAVLNLGAITRANLSQDGTIRFILPVGTQSATNGITTTSPNSTFGLLGTGGSVTSGAAYATVEDGTGTWFATASGGNIVALASTAKNDVTTWLAGDHITDETTGFTGTLQSAYINSLRFNAAGGSDVTMSNTGVLIIGSGGFLITSNVGGTPSLTGGTLVSGASELVITQDSSQPFEIGSDIRINTGVTKTGTGILRLSGDNVYTGVTEIQEGTLQVTGNSIGDSSVVTLSASRPTTLELLADETIGRLQGGSRNTDAEYGMVAVDTHTLTINNSGGNTTYGGFFSGSGAIIKQGTHNLSLTNASSGFTGVLTVESGLLLLGNIGQINANAIRINKGGTLLIDNTGTTRSGTRILDTAAITLNSADGAFQGQTIVRGLAIRSDQDGTLDETVGTVTFNTGASYLGMGTSTTNDDSDIIASDIVRLNRSTMNVRGTALGTNAARSNNFRVVTASETALIASMVGTGTTAGAQNLKILPWGIGEAFANDLADTNMGNSLITYVAGIGFRPLDFATEYDTFASAAADENVRESLTADLTGLTGKTINSLVIDNNNTSVLNVTGSGAGQTLTSTSGAFLFTVSNGVASTAYSTTLGGFDDGIEVSGGEYVFHVVNPSSAANTSTLTATISSPLDSAADITKSGRGTLVFTPVTPNAAGGGANKTTINEGTLVISDLDSIGGNTGGLVFAGGTLQLASAPLPVYSGDDLSQRAITLLDGGGTIDTNGNDVTFASSAGTGVGGLTKAGLGNLTLNAASTFTGGMTVSGGTLTVGASNATGNGGNLTVLGGATFALGANSISHTLVTTSGASPLITGAGTINASTGFFFNHTGDTTIDAVLAGNGDLLKAQANILTLTGASAYTGTTEIQAGTLSINSIGNVGGGASALGSPTTAEDGIIRMGLTTAATTLQYTGSGHGSDRLIGMQGTTGSVTLDADGTGAWGLGGVRFENSGNKTLILRGSSLASLDNTLGAVRELGGVLTLNKSDANTWLLTAANSYTGATQVDNGTLKIGVTESLPVTTAVRIGTGATAGTLDLNGFNQTIGSLVVQSTTNAVTNNIIIDGGNTLTVNGAVTLGVDANASTTAVTATGGGAIVVNSGGANFQVGGANGGTNDNKVTADFSGLNSFTANLGTGTFRLGDNNSGTEDNASTFKLATNNTITAASFRIGDGSGGSFTHTLTLGSGTNLINADTINVGSAGATIRSGGAIVFDGADTTGTLAIRASDGTSRATLNMINTTGSTAGDMISNIGLAGHTADILVGTVTMAARSGSTGGATATLTFDEGTLDVTTLNMASRTGAGTGNAAATLSLGDGAAVGTPTTTIGVLNMAVNTSAGGAVTADLNVSGGNVTIGTGSGTAINMANAGTGRTVTSNVTLTGGTVNLTGNIIRTGGAGTENATVTLNGATLAMGGNSIGSGASAVSLSAQSGTLTGLAELNGGGAFTKSTGGTLSMGNGNTYTGATTITGGTLLAVNTAGSATGSGALNVNGSTILGGTGFIAPTAGNSVTVDGTLSIGLPGDSSGQDMSLVLSGAGNFAINGTVLFDIFANAQTGMPNATGASDLAVVGAADWANIVFGGSSTLKVVTSLDTSTWVNGDAWRIFDWSGIAGGTAPATGFASLDLPSLSGLFWDTSALYTSGVISIVAIPEPSRMIFMLIGILGICFHRRRAK